MDLSKLRKKSFAVYGLGLTGISVINHFKKNNIKDFCVWDDDKIKRFKFQKYLNNGNFSKKLDKVDYIVISPGVNLKKTKFSSKLQKNKNKIITDLDLFYQQNIKGKTIVITGTNGKSTTCKIIEHILKKNKRNVQVGGNIGKPILDLNIKKKSFYIIEASSFQLSNSKNIKPNYALILNISKDHLDWHGNFNNYRNSKMKIFSMQDKFDYALLNDKNLIKIFKKNKFSSKLKIIKSLKYEKLSNKIKNSHLSLKSNKENMIFIFELIKILKIKQKYFLKVIESFKGLNHRHEIFLKKKNISFINDSKATSFEACKFALSSNKNIMWIVGGQPKLKDKFKLNGLSKNIIKTFIIGKNFKFFKNQLDGKVNFEISKTLKKALISIFKTIAKTPDKEISVLLSPGSASFDQFKNFEERGNSFKKLVKSYGKKYL
ncbi:MAG: UDP-N-acetylmuramoyl-L-alanine--D-glutamate ligase [Pelagibacterales bacterium MED-G40]|nr:MAG: UDP-N-acetylmuramoyl-L-alanine--D-glutamate ligase [Candidatus Pelagibacter sp. TMED203]PDH19852.1 MAG: UDP-N-acetylmuramoyl-L-alanine--D-glutamate ligase [Pelagibacterales bacterium MED-G40]|tara:strand:- start:4864 stop:6159 length:1296 start_codon:yes stop_codon:yes gene_type:complete